MITGLVYPAVGRLKGNNIGSWVISKVFTSELSFDRYNFCLCAIHFILFWFSLVYKINILEVSDTSVDCIFLKMNILLTLFNNKHIFIQKCFHIEQFFLVKIECSRNTESFSYEG